MIGKEQMSFDDCTCFSWHNLGHPKQSSNSFFFPFLFLFKAEIFTVSVVRTTPFIFNQGATSGIIFNHGATSGQLVSNK